METRYTNTSALELPGMADGKPISHPELAASTIHYCLYARKSSEDDERQALSIDSQIKEMSEQAVAQGLLVTEIRCESHSAKESSQRPVFNQLLEDVRKGIFQGILSWAPDRLSRNAGDLGTVVDLMDSGNLIAIRTHGQLFTNTPNDKFLLMILCSQAKLENDNRGVNVKRGMKTKCELGFRPNMTPLGYENDHYSGKGQKKVYVDQPRAIVVQEMFRKVADEKFTGRRIYDWLKDETDFRTRKGKFVTLAMVYRMLNNPYYCGLFEYPVGSGKWFKGSYEPIIDKELFKRVQQQLTTHPKTKPGTKTFDFTKLLKCGTCGSGITASEKQRPCKDGLRRHVYYHCTQARHIDCKEYIKEDQLVEQFTILLANITSQQINAKEKVRDEFEKFNRFNAAIYGYAVGDINLDPWQHIQNFTTYIFKNGTREEKRDLISCIKGQLYLKDRKLLSV